MTKFKEGDDVYVVSGDGASARKIVKVVPREGIFSGFQPQKYIVSGEPITNFLSPMINSQHPVVEERDLVERSSDETNSKPNKKTKK